MTPAYIFCGILAFLGAIAIFIICCEQEVTDDRKRSFYDHNDDEHFIC